MNPSKTKFDFDPIAVRYDRCNHWFSFGMDRRWRRRVVQTLNPNYRQRVLDVCTGTGDMVFAFLKHSSANYAAGLDVSESMLSRAQEKEIYLGSTSWLRHKRIEWRRAEAAETGLDSKQFDFITCAFGLRNIDNRQAALGEMHRLLKPGGKLCILEFSLPSNAVWRGMYRIYLNYLMPVAGRLVVRSAEPLIYLARSIQQWHKEVDFARELSAGGFTLVRKNPLSGGIVTLWLARK